MKRALSIAIIIVMVVGGLVFYNFLSQMKRGSESVPISETYTFNRDWLKKGVILVFGQPPIDYLQTVGAKGTAWSVYFSGLNDYDRGYVNSLHKNAFIVCSGPPTVQSFITNDEKLKMDASCRDIYGNPIKFLGSDQYAMCGNNPKWQEFLMKRFEEHVNGGVDAILIDEIGYVDCFCDYCMEAFNSYLKSHYSNQELLSLFGISNISSFNYRNYLLEHGATSEWDDPNPKLLLEFYKARYSARVAFISKLIQHTRSVSGRVILFSGNLYGLQPNQQIYLPYLDFVIFEMPITPEKHDWLSYLKPLPGKHITTYLLAEAAAPEKPFIAFPDIFDFTVISEDEWKLWGHWLAEARMCGASFLLPYKAYVYGGGTYTIQADKISPYTKFFNEHSYLYDNVSRIAKVAILFDLHSTLFNSYLWKAYSAWESFENLGVTLQEAHIPFEVIYNGDGEFVNKSLTINDLNKYSIIIIPKNYDLNDEVSNLLNKYIKQGGHVIAMDNLSQQSDLIGEIKAISVDIGLETNASKDVGLMVYEKGGSLIVHVINYKYDTQTKTFASQTNIEINVTLPENVNPAGKTLKAINLPDGSEATVKYTIIGGKLNIIIPKLNEYLILHFK